MEVNFSKVLQEYNKADERGKKILEEIFGKEAFMAKDVTDRVKTFEDACRELGEGNSLVQDWKMNVIKSPDVEAYLKLRIIAAALNEGWETEFVEDEWRYSPYFYLYSKEKIDKMDEKDKEGLFLWGGLAYIGANCGLAFAYSYVAFSLSNPNFGARIALKSEELAVYCGKQFISIWKDYVGPFNLKEESDD